MIKSRFEEIIRFLKAQNTFQENAVTEASKLLEINYTMRQVDQEIDRCKSTIIESLKGHEAVVQTLARLENEREKIAISHKRLSDYADNARPQMIKIEKARNDASLMLLNDEKIDQEYEIENARELRDAMQEINDERLKVLDDLGTVEQSIKSLETELKDVTTCIRLQKIENAALHTHLNQKRTDIFNRHYKLVAKYNDLSKSKKGNEEKSGVKVEKNVVFLD